jgi:hypothetical protein
VVEQPRHGDLKNTVLAGSCTTTGSSTRRRPKRPTATRQRRQLAVRLVGILDGCLKTRPPALLLSMSWLERLRQLVVAQMPGVCRSSLIAGQVAARPSCRRVR